MNALRFDEIARMFAKQRLSRRRALAQAGAGLATGLLTAGTAETVAQVASPAPIPSGRHTATLFVQSFHGGSITPMEGEVGRYTVTLTDGLGQTIFFSDRPDRVVGATPTDQFIGALGFLPENPPNAALVVHTESGETDIAVVELFNPVFDPEGPGMTYDIEILDNWEDSLELGLAEQPALLETIGTEFGAAHLFIDDCPDGDITCYNGDTYVGLFANDQHGGYCYSWSAGNCYPCFPNKDDYGESVLYWSRQCDQGFARCNGNCRARQVCGGGWLCPDQ